MSLKSWVYRRMFHCVFLLLSIPGIATSGEIEPTRDGSDVDVNEIKEIKEIIHTSSASKLVESLETRRRVSGHFRACQLQLRNGAIPTSCFLYGELRRRLEDGFRHQFVTRGGWFQKLDRLCLERVRESRSLPLLRRLQKVAAAPGVCRNEAQRRIADLLYADELSAFEASEKDAGAIFETSRSPDTHQGNRANSRGQNESVASGRIRLSDRKKTGTRSERSRLSRDSRGQSRPQSPNRRFEDSQG